MTARPHTLSDSIALGANLLTMLRDDPGVQAVLGHPARLFDGEASTGYLPYVVMERHEVTPLERSEVATEEHIVTLASRSCFDGIREAKSILNALSEAVNRLGSHLGDIQIVLAHVSYCDAMRTADQRAFRGLIRIRLIVEVAE